MNRLRTHQNNPNCRTAQRAEKQDRHDGVVPDGVLGANLIDAEEQCRYQAGSYPVHKKVGQASSLSVVPIPCFVAADVSRLKLLSMRSEPTHVGCYDPRGIFTCAR